MKFGLVGCGRIAQRHAEHISNNGLLVAVCGCRFHNLKILKFPEKAPVHFQDKKKPLRYRVY